MVEPIPCSFDPADYTGALMLIERIGGDILIFSAIKEEVGELIYSAD